MDVTDEMVAQGYTPQKMFDLAEQFFIQIGARPMTDIFKVSDTFHSIGISAAKCCDFSFEF